MVRSDLGASGVMFTMDTESGFKDAVFISSYGLGEAVVQGGESGRVLRLQAGVAGRPAGDPQAGHRRQGDQDGLHLRPDGREDDRVRRGARGRQRLAVAYRREVTELARQALVIEDHYGRPMDIEWGKDGLDGQLYILQARPETVQSRAPAGSVHRYRMSRRGTPLIEGRAIGQKIGAGRVRVLRSVDTMHEFVPGEVLVADMTDPDWEPIAKRARRSSPTGAGGPATPRSSPVAPVSQRSWAPAVRLGSFPTVGR